MRNKFANAILLSFFIFSCTQTETKQKEERTSAFSDYYEFSEMALLMEQMYEDLAKTKVQILENQEIGGFPDKYNKIHTAKMSADFDRNEEFNRFANLYLQNLKILHESSPEDIHRPELFNNVVNSCITCHKSDSGCIGPVSRIGKLGIE